MNNFAKVFADLSDEALLKRFCSGVLTEEAEVIAKMEIVSRGLPLPTEPAVEDELHDATADEDLVAVARGLLPLEARVIQGFLEAEGIYAFVADENLMNALPIWSHSAFGGARVLVRRSRVTEAVKLLASRSNDEYELGEGD